MAKTNRLFPPEQHERQSRDFYNHAWLIWDWHRDATKLPFDLSPGDPRLKTGCAVCGASLEHMRAGAKTCSARCRRH